MLISKLEYDNMLKAISMNSKNLIYEPFSQLQCLDKLSLNVCFNGIRNRVIEIHWLQFQHKSTVSIVNTLGNSNMWLIKMDTNTHITNQTTLLIKIANRVYVSLPREFGTCSLIFQPTVTFSSQMSRIKLSTLPISYWTKNTNSKLNKVRFFLGTWINFNHTSQLL